jgi:hypothetical protein
MEQPMKRFPMALAALICLAVPVCGGEKVDENKDLAIDVAKAGPDFNVQGEYAGELTTADGKKKFGAHIAALGGGNFRALYYYGGLPGDGWDGDPKLRIATKEKWAVCGKTEGDKTVFDKPYAATLSGGTLSGKNDKGEAFECKKVLRESPTLGAKPPEGATVLFDGTNLDKWSGKGEIDERKAISTAHGDVFTKAKFKDYILHVEYMEPFKPYGRDQGRGNSGVYMQHRYEIQVLDSFGCLGENNEAGGIYSNTKPRLNMVYPPLCWQTYDFDFTAAKFDDAGKKVKNAVITVKHNGVLIHENQEIKGPTGGGDKESAEGGPIFLQGHGNPVFYRNIWIVEKK